MRTFISFISCLLPLGFAQSISYQTALELAQQGPSVQLATTQLELAQKQLVVASSLVQANISGGYSQTWGSLNAPSLTEPESLNKGNADPLGISASFNVIPFGPRFDQVTRQRWALQRAEQALRDTQADAIMTVTQQYQAVVVAQEQQVLAEMQLEFTQLSLTNVQMQLAAGAANESQVSQAEISVAQAKQTLLNAQQSLVQGLSSLSITIGQPVTEVESSLPETKVLLVEDAFKARSDVANAQLAIQEAELTANSTLRDNLPGAALSLNYTASQEGGQFQLGSRFDTSTYQPSVSASYDFDYEAPNGLPGQSSSSFTISLSASIPLDIALSDALAAARLNIEQSQLQAAQVLEAARLDITGKQQAATSAETSLKLSQQLLEQAHMTVNIAEQRFAAGIISKLDLQQSQLELKQAEINVLQAENALRLAHMQLAIAQAVSPLEVY